MTPLDSDLPGEFSLQFEFTGAMWPWRGPAPYHFITVPDDVSTEVRSLSPLVSYGWGVIPVSVRIGDTEWGTSLFPEGWALRHTHQGRGPSSGRPDRWRRRHRRADRATSSARTPTTASYS